MKESRVFKSFEAIPSDPDVWPRVVDAQPRLAQSEMRTPGEPDARRPEVAPFTREVPAVEAYLHWGINE